MMESTVEMVTVRMSRGEISTPWGFDVVPPAIITRVVGGSLADRAGLQNGDHIDEIQGENSDNYEKIRHLLHTAGHEIDLVVLREPTVEIKTRVWHPSVTIENQERNNYSSSSSSTKNIPSVKVSLEHRPLQSQVVPGFNTSAQPYHSELNNNQILNTDTSSNLPYINKAEKYLLEKGGLFGTDPKIMKAREQPSYMQSETLKLIQEREKNGFQKKPQQEPIQQQQIKKPDNVFTKKESSENVKNMPHCFICNRGIVGIMCKVNEAVVHPECFQCSTCGASLKNVGHHYIDEKFYCDIHGQQRRQLTSVRSSNGKPAPPIISTMDRRPLNPDLVVKTPPTASQPTYIPEPPKAFYQPEVLAPGPLSPQQLPRKPQIDSYAKTSVFNESTYNPDSVSNEEVITIGKLNQQSTSATLEARQMSRTFAPFARSRSVRGIQWPPEPETEKSQKSLEAIKYWKLTVEPAEKQKKSLQELINEEQESAKKFVRDVPPPEKQKLNAKRVIPTPHRLNSPMRNPLEAYAEKLRASTNNLTRTKSATSVIGPPPAVNVSWNDIARPIPIKPNNQEESVEIPDINVNNHDDERIKTEEIKTNDDDWHYRSQVLEEKDILTDVSSRQSDNDDEEEYEDGLKLPQFDERTSQFLNDQTLRYSDSVSPSVDDLDRKSPASTIKENDDEYVISQEEKDKWIQEEIEEARYEEAKTKKNGNIDDDNIEKTCLDVLAKTPIPTDTDDDIPRTDEIKIIEEHQNNLQTQQEQLSQLLDNAIRYLKETDTKPKLTPQQISPNIDYESPSGKILQKIIAHDDDTDDDGLRKMNLYDQQQQFHHQNHQQQNQYYNDNNGYNNGYSDGVKQHGQLMNSNNMIPFCEQCKQQIRGAYVLATGLTWCPEHFTCANPACNRRLLDTGFVEEKGKKYCEKCFETLIAPICSKCAMPITADCLTALQKQWHPECFVCHHCSRPFGNAAFYLENGKPYCEQDWNTLFTTKCVSCKYPIEAGDRWVEAIGSAFHSNCFSCTVCQVNLEGQSFYAKNGLPFCRIHA